jgi:hypothetical protein
MDSNWPDPRFRELSPERLASISSEEIGPAVVQHVHLLRLASGDDELSAVGGLARGIQAIYTTWTVDAEVLNGGFNQFFYNPHGALAGDALAGYELLGAEDYAEVMRAAIATYESERDQLRPFHDQGTLEAFSESYKHTDLNSIDDRYYALGDRIYEVWATSVRARPELFRVGSADGPSNDEEL